MDKKIKAVEKKIDKSMEGLIKADKVRDKACDKAEMMAKKKKKKK